MDDLIEALLIFRKYANPDNPTGCSHDRMGIMGVGEVSDDDHKRLKELDFIWDNVEEYWFSYRFGSA